MTFENYHFHLYFGRDQLATAKLVLDKLDALENIEIGRLWEEPIGPHPVGSCQVVVRSDDFERILVWFLQERKGLDVFIHALSGDNLKDHTDYTMWIGRQYQLNLDIFR